MAIYYVRSGATGLNNGTSWTDAYTAFASAVTAATTNGDFIYVAHDHAEDLGADTTYTFGAHVTVLCVNTGTGAVTTGGVIGPTSSSVSITLNGAFRVAIHGLTFRNAGTLNKGFVINGSIGGHFELRECVLSIGTTSIGARLELSSSGASARGFVNLYKVTFRFGHASQGIIAHTHATLQECSLDGAGTIPTTLFSSAIRAARVVCMGCDLSAVTGTLVPNNINGTFYYEFINCRLGSGVVPFATQTTSPNKSSGSVTVIDCAAGDQHYHFAHYDALGSTVVDTGVYANDGAQYDGTNRCSWKITTTADCSYWTPYTSPWFTKYHAATASITPYVEALRDGSTTAYTDAELWLELAAKTTSGSTQSTIYSDRMAPLGTPANQAAGVGLSGWTGEGGSAWSGKLDSGSAFTPAEIGDIAVRVVFGKPSSVVYVDPTIRGV